MGSVAAVVLSSEGSASTLTVERFDDYCLLLKKREHNGGWAVFVIPSLWRRAHVFRVSSGCFVHPRARSSVRLHAARLRKKRKREEEGRITKGREGKGREGKGREGEGKGREGKGRNRISLGRQRRVSP